MSQELECVMGCNHFTGGEVKHHRDCPFYDGSMAQELARLKFELDLYKQIANDYTKEPKSIREFEKGFVLLDHKAREADMLEGDWMVFFPRDVEQPMEVWQYLTHDGYGFYARQLGGYQNTTLAISQCCKIFATMGDIVLTGVPNLKAKF